MAWLAVEKRTAPCRCTVPEAGCVSAGVAVRPCGCARGFCYTEGVCGNASRAFPGAWYRACGQHRALAWECTDPLDQWHHDHIRMPGAWARSRGERDVHMVVMDDGIQYAHADLQIARARSFGWNGTDRVPSAEYAGAVHGTAVAEIMAATANNAYGGCGIAWNATIAAVRLIDPASGILFRNFERSLEEFMAGDAVVCNSWGPLDGTQHVLDDRTYGVIKRYATEARDGRGGVIVWAAGNGGAGDDVSADGFASHPGVLSVGSVDAGGRRTGFSEPGACLDIVAPTNVPTTTLYGDARDFAGTSSSAPVVAAVAALVMSVRGDLGGRDVRDVLVTSARRNDANDASWVRNAAGYWHSRWYGFGTVDAHAALRAAETWRATPQLVQMCAPGWQGERALATQPLRLALPAIGGDALIVDTVTVYVRIAHAVRGAVAVTLVSPSGTRNGLVAPSVARTGSFVPHAYVARGFYGEVAGPAAWHLEVHSMDAAGYLHGAQLCVHARNASHAPLPPPPPPATAAPGTHRALFALGVAACVGAVVLGVRGGIRVFRNTRRPLRV